jgi:hypothetical protein
MEKLRESQPTLLTLKFLETNVISKSIQNYTILQKLVE